MNNHDKTILYGLLLVVAVLLVGCQRENTEPYDGWHYECTIYIDSTDSACGVDSCVLNLPWLHSMVEQAIADTSIIPYIEDREARRNGKGTRLEVYRNQDHITDVYYFSIIDHLTDTVYYDCDGNAIEYHYDSNMPGGCQIVDINIGWCWVAPI